MNEEFDARVTPPVARFARCVLALSVLVMMWSRPVKSADQTTDDGKFAARKTDAEEYFQDRVAPFIRLYCIDCHSNRRPTEAGVNFSPALKAPGHAAFSEQWKKAVARVKAHDMPPEEMGEQPSDADRRMFIDWLAKIRFLSERDPGPFVIRRLTKTEYGNTLHDLFGVDPKIAENLPDDVSGEGYLNSLSPLQLEQYLSIAEKVLDQILAPRDATPTEMQTQLFGQPPANESNARSAGARSRPATCAEGLSPASVNI